MAKELTVIEVGLDLGNDTGAIAMRDANGEIKTAKVQVAHSLTKPMPKLIKNQYGKLNAFGLIMKDDAGQDTVFWFGPDVLNLGDYEIDYHEIDSDKYDHPDYLRRVALAALHTWAKKNVKGGELPTAGIVYRLNVSMPPEDFANKTLREAARKAYRSAFDTEKKIYLKVGKGKARQINIKLGSLTGETTGYLQSHRRKHGDETVYIVDLGYGTNDKALFMKGDLEAYAVSSKKDTGLIHAYEASGGNRAEVERNVISGGQWPRGLVNHIRKVADDIKVVKRKLNGHYFKHLVIMGGGGALIKKNKKAKALFTSITDKVFILDEYVTAIANLENSEG